MVHTMSSGAAARLRTALPSHAGVLSVLEILVLGLLSAFVVLQLVPATVGIEWQCVGTYGVQRIAGDSYLDAASVVGTFGWLAVAAGVLYAQIAESRRLAVLLPLAWFGVFVSGSVITAISMGPQLCPG